MIIQCTALIFRIDQTADQVITFGSCGTSFNDNLLDRVVQTLCSFSSKGAKYLSLVRINLVTGNHGKCPSRILLVLIRIITREPHQGVHDTEREIQREIHQIRFLVLHHRRQKVLTNNTIDFRAPFVHRVRHENRLQKSTGTAMLLTIHSQNDQPVKKRPQPLSNEAIREGVGVTHYRHHIFMLE
ncbi:hypothetical protein D3C81_1473520 [compost metagenome]